ncbi:MAG TPA: single-stranded DNA-binding protein, partial [Methylomirabilota bacterium]|nr:single-stranded DNA-binding protein [Methylomirabilota bacterium]
MAVDPELKYTDGGIAVCSFRLAVDRPYCNKITGEKECDFLDVVSWRAAAEFTASYLNKGRMVGLTGRLQVRAWTASDGTKRRTTEVIASDVRALDS